MKANDFNTIFRALLTIGIAFFTVVGFSVELEKAGPSVSLVGRLGLVFIDDFERGQADVHYLLLTDDGGRYRLEFTEDPQLPSGERFEFHGVLDDGVLYPERYVRLSPDPVPVGDNPNLGEQKMAVLLVNSFENPVEPATAQEIRDRVFDEGNPYSINNYIKEVSFEKAWLTGEVFGWYTLPVTEYDLCNDYLALLDAAIAAADPDVYFPDYFRLMIVFPEAGCSWWGGALTVFITLETADGDVDMTFCLINSVGHVGGTDQPDGTGCHELGHNFGCMHANDWECGDVVIDGDCSSVNYGDICDTMGTSQGGCHFNAPHKETIGWLEPAQILETTKPGTYVIEPIETNTGGLKALKIPLSGSQAYYVEYRRAIGFDARLPQVYGVDYDGALIHINQSDAAGDTQLLDMTPHHNDSVDQYHDSLCTVLNEGRTFRDPNHGLAISTLAVTEDSLVVEIGNFEPYLVTGPGPGYDNPPTVRVSPPEQGAEFVYEFPAYGAPHYGVNVTCGDVNGDRSDEILTGAGPGAVFGPHVRGFQKDGTPLPGLSFLAYGTYKWGVNVAAGDIDGDSRKEIITGAGPGAVFGPHVRAFSYDDTCSVTTVPGCSFFAYGTPRWGVNVACGDVDGDGMDEIVTGAGPGAIYGPHVRGWNVDGGTASAISGVSFMAYGTNKYGVNVTCGDIDGDGMSEIVTGAGPGDLFGAHVRGWNYDGTALTALAGINFFAWPSEEVRYGAKVYAGADLDGDGWTELVVGQGPDPSAATPVIVYRFDGEQLIRWFDLEAYSGLTHGTSVAAGGF